MKRAVTEALKSKVKWHKDFLLCDPREACEMELHSTPAWQVTRDNAGYMRTWFLGLVSRFVPDSSEITWFFYPYVSDTKVFSEPENKMVISVWTMSCFYRIRVRSLLIFVLNFQLLRSKLEAHGSLSYSEILT